MRRLLVTTTAALTIARLAARLLYMPARPPIVPIAWDRTETPVKVELVKWEQHVDEALALCDPAGDWIDITEQVELARIVHSGWGATFLAAIDEAEGCDDLLAALDGEA